MIGVGWALIHGDWARLTVHTFRLAEPRLRCGRSTSAAATVFRIQTFCIQASTM